MNTDRKKVDGHEAPEGYGRLSQDREGGSGRSQNSDEQAQQASNRRDISDVDRQEGQMDNGQTGGEISFSEGEENY
jgi:hypothetical protein